MKALIRFYQNYLSPTRFGMNTCRFTPSCSEYMYESIDKFGCIKGIYLGFWRLLRCNPFSHGGYDPVPVRQ